MIDTRSENEGASRVHVTNLQTPPRVDAIWDKEPWVAIEPFSLKEIMGPTPDFQPTVEVKLGYDSEAVYVIFRVQDRYVMAVEDTLHGPVCKDSCVEFFFTPGTDVRKGYFNLETHCGGVMLFHFQERPRQNTQQLPVAACEAVQLAHSLPSRVEPEIEEPVTWTLEYRLPYGILRRFTTLDTPESGAEWRANFYKCASRTSNAHWMTWAPIARSKPDFHVPECFGTLHFV